MNEGAVVGGNGKPSGGKRLKSGSKHEMAHSFLANISLVGETMGGTQAATSVAGKEPSINYLNKEKENKEKTTGRRREAEEKGDEEAERTGIKKEREKEKDEGRNQAKKRREEKGGREKEKREQKEKGSDRGEKVEGEDKPKRKREKGGKEGESEKERKIASRQQSEVKDKDRDKDKDKDKDKDNEKEKKKERENERVSEDEGWEKVEKLKPEETEVKENQKEKPLDKLKGFFVKKPSHNETKKKDAFDFLNSISLEKPPLMASNKKEGKTSNPIVAPSASAQQANSIDDESDESDASSATASITGSESESESGSESEESFDQLSPSLRPSKSNSEDSDSNYSKDDQSSGQILDSSLLGRESMEVGILTDSDWTEEDKHPKRRSVVERFGSTSLHESDDLRHRHHSASSTNSVATDPRLKRKKSDRKGKNHHQIQRTQDYDEFDDEYDTKKLQKLDEEDEETEKKTGQHPVLKTIKGSMYLTNNTVFSNMVKSEYPLRIFYTTSTMYSKQSFPFAIGSILPVDDDKRKRRKTANTPGELTKTPRTVSFSDILAKEVNEIIEKYDPNYLDDPELKTGKHKVVLKLPFVMGSVFHYVRATELKNELNEKFKLVHEDLNPEITLSKIRNVKEALIQIAFSEEIDLEAVTVAIAFVYFERLVLKGYVTKVNRKAVAASCLILAGKINDSKLVLSNDLYPILYEAIEKHLSVSKKAVQEQEFEVFVQLDFSLHVNVEHVVPHFLRIIAAKEFSSVQEYLGKKSYELYLQTNAVKTNS